MSTYTIGTLGQAAGVGVETIRYYQRRGLLPTPKAPTGIRRYGQTDLTRLRFIRHAQHLGFSLEEVAELLALDEMDDREAARTLAQGKLQEIQTRIRRLQTMEAALRGLISCCEAAPGSAPCPILHTLGAEDDPLANDGAQT